MTSEDQALLLSQIIEHAREGHRHAAMGTVQSRAFHRIIRLAKRLHLDAIKTKEENPTP